MENIQGKSEIAIAGWVFGDPQQNLARLERHG
jgi:hypothetical protein